MPLPAASYAPLSAGLYEISFANVLYRPVSSNGVWYDGGDLDSFSLNINPTRKQRYAKNGSVSYLATEATTRIDSTVTAKFMQKTKFIRAASLLGVAYDVNQAPGVVTADVLDLVAGGFYTVGAYGIGTPTVQYMKGNALAPLPPAYFRLVDAALGIIQVLQIPDDATLDANGRLAGKVGGTVAAGDAGSQTRIDIGTVPQVELEMMIRNVSDIGPKGYLHLYQVNMAPDGEMGFITGNEDFEGVTIKGRAAKTSRGIGYWQSLAA